MKAAGEVLYVGVTTSEGRRHRELERVMRGQPLDFAQLTYNVLDREAEDRLLPLARDRGIGVIANRPFREGALLRRVERHPLPAWAGEIGCASWAQLLLRFIVSHPAVTCAIPTATRTEHAREDMGAAHGPLPDEARAGAWSPTSRRSDGGVVDLLAVGLPALLKPSRTWGGQVDLPRPSARS